MERSQHPLLTARRSRGRMFAGLILCALVVVFSIAAKVNWYHQSSTHTPSIAKQKAFKAEPPAHTPPEASAPLALTALPVVFALAALFLFEALCTERKTQKPRRAAHGFFETTAARPPPAR